jgi:hypothetical protein
VAAIPQTHFVQSGDADLADQVFGAGEDMVAIPGLPSHLEVMWKPGFAAFLDRLASFRPVITFDTRGTGMSDRVPMHQVLSAVAQPRHRRRVHRGARTGSGSGRRRGAAA